ncbi:uncharacterized protein LOC143535173 [Bidens hawaiensis]|uniref:uncharacterized protein LOC143535173 n=1 Tax=Bidens hawaiensis TaxID=980011 RepID=UPI00404B5AF9
MADGWRDIRHRHLINFLVYCEKGISFLKSIDASDIESNSENLCNLFVEVVEMVGVKNVVQIVTDNAANYKCVGQMLCKKYCSITWTPCVAPCLNLALKDVSELDNVAKLVKLASKVTVFIYNQKTPLNWLRKREGWTEIVRPGSARFATTFIELKSLVDHKNDLQALVISAKFKKMMKLGNANESEWWRLFGGDYPKMQTFAVRILSQTPFSLGCERNWSVFERIHTKRRNRLEHERLNDLVYVHYNLRLQNRLKYAKRSYDPVDYESINHTEFWVVEEEPEGELNNDDIDTMFGEEENEPVSQTQGNESAYTLVDEDGSESEFHILSDREVDLKLALL